MNPLFTIGHSNHPIEKFLLMVREHSIRMVCDVRSSPYRKFAPQYDRGRIEGHMATAEVGYLFLGAELGERSAEDECYDNGGRVVYGRVAETPSFVRGLSTLTGLVTSGRATLLCTERDPIGCHRMILIGRALRTSEIDMVNILDDGKPELLRASEIRLLRVLRLPQLRLMEDMESLIGRAYAEQERRIAHTRDEPCDTNTRSAKS